MSLIGSEILAGASGSGVSAYEIEQSLRFETNSATEMQKNFSTESNRTTSTTSVWIKRGRLEVVDYCIWSARETANFWEEFTIYSDGSIYALCKYNGATRWNMRTSALLRDPSAWYHLVYVRDTSNATQADRIRIYVNGERVTSWATQTEPASSGLAGFLGGNFEHKLGKRAGYDDETYDGYMAEFHYLDGTANNADSFGEFDSNGVWRPIEYTGGGYGTNGLYLKFDPAATNGIGEDYSGNGHTMPDNLFTTSGTGTDVMSDTPTTNWCTLNPLGSTAASQCSNGNLEYYNGTTAVWRSAVSTFAVSSGKWYFEAKFTNFPASSGAFVGVGRDTIQWVNNSSYIGQSSVPGSYGYYSGNGNIYDGSGAPTYGSTYSTNDLIGCALDLDAGTLHFYKNGVDQGEAASGLTGTWNFGVSSLDTPAIVNFGQRDFEQTPPTGFKALNTSNLPAPDIADGSQYFNTVLYTGNGSTQSITGVGFQPDFTWIKKRGSSGNHMLTDAVRGANTEINSNTTAAETANTNALTSFDTDGFSVGADGAVNISSEGVVAWNWLAGGSTSSNTTGSITSTVSANPTAGFSIVSYTSPNNTADQTVGHGLGVKPSLIIVKNRDLTYNWDIYHASLGYNASLIFTTAATRSGAFGAEPTSTLFTTKTGYTHNGTNDYVAYCFAEVEGYSKFGSYTGNGNSSEGPFVYCGHKVAWVCIKRTDAASEWAIYDNRRPGYNPNRAQLRANAADAENTNSVVDIDTVSNGFKIRTSDAAQNASGGTYIFMALAENPFGGSGVSPATAR